MLDPFGLMTEEERAEVTRRMRESVQDPYICVRGGFEPVQWGGANNLSVGETTGEALAESWDDFNGTGNTIADFAPGLGNAKGAQEAVTGKNIVTGEVLTAGDRITAGVAIFGGPLVKGGQKLFKGGKKLVKWLRKSDDCPTSDQDTITRYMTQGEVDEALDKGNIPNYGPDGINRPTHLTTDPPLDSATEAASKYEITPPTHRATVPKERVPNLETPPDGRPVTSGGGSQTATSDPIPVDPSEIIELNE